MHSTAQDGLKLIACTIGRDARVGDERVLGASWRLGHAPGHGLAGRDAWAFLLTRDRRLCLARLLGCLVDEAPAPLVVALRGLRTRRGTASG